ncbi:MAG TPA: response regulator [Thermoanaerobaculia bacterium]|nr:response regulator [Thermoanaerobaculia bacterium]
MSALIQAAKTSVAPDLLHDLRTPLNQIIGYSDMLCEEAGPEREALAADLGKIRAAGYRILTLIEENFTSAVERGASALGRRRPERDAIDSTVPPATPVVAPGVLLVVDDQASNREVLSRRLERHGHTVVTANNGSDALALMGDTPFDLVLLDIMMPDMDGYEVLRRIKSDERFQPIPVVMISAVDELQSVVRCIAAGAEDHLAKPFNPTLLQARIGACLEKKRSRDRETLLFDQLQKNYKRLEEAEKLRDDLRNMIVHDLRTPLTAVIAGVDMLGRGNGLDEMQREMIAIAAGGGRTLLGMINDLLDVEKMEAGMMGLHYEDLSAAALVSNAVAEIRSLAEANETSLVTVLEEGLPPFAGDANKLGRTLVNLIANAIRFTPGGTVTITAGVDRAVDGVRNVRFEVADTGRGIPADAFERIFEKFGQLDPHSKISTGLGLAFCKLAVEAHGGRIAVESTPGAGSTFSFRFPLVAPRSL